MILKLENKKYSCPFEYAIDAMGGKWKGLVLWKLSEKTMRHGELKRNISKITQKMLTQTLRELENLQVVHREVYAVVPPKVEYSLTKFGKTLMPILEQLNQWGIDTSDELELFKNH